MIVGKLPNFKVSKQLVGWARNWRFNEDTICLEVKDSTILICSEYVEDFDCIRE